MECTQVPQHIIADSSDFNENYFRIFRIFNLKQKKIKKIQYSIQLPILLLQTAQGSTCRQLVIQYQQHYTLPIITYCNKLYHIPFFVILSQHQWHC